MREGDTYRKNEQGKIIIKMYERVITIILIIYLKIYSTGKSVNILIYILNDNLSSVLTMPFPRDKGHLTKSSTTDIAHLFLSYWPWSFKGLRKYTEY